MLTPIAAVLGIVAGLLRGGRFGNLAGLSVRWLPVLLIGLIAQMLSDQVAGFGGVPVLFAGSVVLLIGLLRNLHLRGAAIVSFGLLLNLLVLASNGHVPTRFDSLDAVGKISDSVRDANPEDINIGRVGQLETDDTVLASLGDIVPVPGIDEVISFGDLIVIAGVFVLCLNLLPKRSKKGISIDELFGVEAIIDVSDHRGWGNDEVGSLDSIGAAEGVVNVSPTERRASSSSAVQHIDLDADHIDTEDLDPEYLDLTDEAELALSTSEDELLAPFPYPDSSIR